MEFNFAHDIWGRTGNDNGDYIVVHLPMSDRDRECDPCEILELVKKAHGAIQHRAKEIPDPDIPVRQSQVEKELVRNLEQAVLSYNKRSRDARESDSNTLPMLYYQLTELASDVARHHMLDIVDRAHADEILPLLNTVKNFAPDEVLKRMPDLLQKYEMPDYTVNLLDITCNSLHGATSGHDLFGPVQTLWNRYVAQDAGRKLTNRQGIVARLLILQGLLEESNPGGFKAAFDAVIEKNEANFSASVLFMAAKKLADIKFIPPNGEVTRETFLRRTLDLLQNSGNTISADMLRRNFSADFNSGGIA
jgi:hypothetical protein